MSPDRSEEIDKQAADQAPRLLTTDNECGTTAVARDRIWLTALAAFVFVSPLLR